MKGIPFLDDRPEQQNQTILALSRMVIVQSAVAEKLIEDDDLAMIPECMPILMRLAGQLRDDLYSHHSGKPGGLKFPIIQNCFGYAFAKGAESAYLWNESSDGRFEFNYSPEDAIEGRAGTEVDQNFANVISVGMITAANVFCDFQDKFLADKDLDFAATGGRWLADGIACGLFWASQIGIDFGMAKLGNP
jgi:hypothetical protein